MSVPRLRFIGGGLKMNGVHRTVFETDTHVLPKPAVVVEVPTVAPEPAVVVEVPAVAPEPAAVAEVPTVAPLEVEPPAEVSQAAPETGLVPEDPSAK